MRRSAVAAAFVPGAVLALSACVAPPRPAPPTAPPVIVMPPAPAPQARSADWRDWPATPGDWRYRRLAGATAAEYGDARAVHVALRCEAGRLRLVWPAARPGGVRIVTTSADTSRAGVPAPEGGVQLLFDGRDPLLDAMAFSRGRFVLQAEGAELVLPAWPELSRVIEDCRAASGE